ncbi:hypothetical protein N5D52_27385 [Pseudomonas sp. GD03860]|uniref:hypothetical protein n=1 Tax=Pseudomonas sp. GD03860 TaxID=2975389 RepID=UPI0024480767|nr:hypothetical protein [Pseudomonas sp. GD03860]MDH0640652.1 hypothetical protein [Pseudomonas sp. GD03860]
MAQLNASIHEYLAKGGQVDQLPGPSFKPRPARPVSDGAIADDETMPTPKPGSSAELNLIRTMAKTMSFSEASKASGIPRSRLVQLTKAHLIRFQVSSTERRARDEARKRRETQKLNHCEQIRALAGTGVTRNQAAQQIGISYGYLVRLLEEYGIDYPVRGLLK